MSQVNLEKTILLLNEDVIICSFEELPEEHSQ